MDEQTLKAAADLAAGNPAINGTVLALVDVVERLADEPVYNAGDAEPQAPVMEDIPDAAYARLVHESAALPSGRADTAADYWAEVSW